ncbi:hypothetical protein EMO92_07255 [Bifidobacterium reuteri]|uniref:Uncharacterized protein n=1 Tax=Bifidobacterium reuteri TaxID=983706 RepID=A0A5J5E7I0_9BIFI|nr:hypothetical protein EMO92_07255 [Bifidobacterium reuteri]
MKFIPMARFPDPITEPFFSLLSHPAAPSAGFLRFAGFFSSSWTALWVLGVSARPSGRRSTE